MGTRPTLRHCGHTPSPLLRTPLQPQSRTWSGNFINPWMWDQFLSAWAPWRMGIATGLPWDCPQALWHGDKEHALPPAATALESFGILSWPDGIPGALG